MSKIKTLILLSISILTFAGCTTMSVKPLTTGSADSYEQHDQKNGLDIGIRPMTKKREIEDIFSVNLLKKGLLPILVVAENQSVSNSFVIAKDKVYVVNEDTGTTNTSQSKDIQSGRSAAGQAVALVFAGGLLSLEGLKMASDATVIQYNLADKEFYSETLGPRQKTRGFIYFQFPKESPPVANYHVVAEVKNSATGETTTFDFPVNLTLPN